MFGAEIDDALSTQSDRKSFLPLTRDKHMQFINNHERFAQPGIGKEGSIMEDELRSLQTKIMDLETKLSFAHHPDDLVGDAKRIVDVTQDGKN